ncbi:AIPR family protein [Bradyrhizobium barranii subsp. apii]|uniref:AIPR family protein n=1 Tax=Bradyrhizobium barranii subsp. apii TaxID=2819348 RepID=A0A8T5UWT6_9BRAD|nr:AIPR family protein [Bradyrhizobium barranii]UPT87022.1 AIPR family protein [Bradyrhizobium barranii subsp. apii]
MTDEAMEAFARELASEVDEAIQSGDGSIYSEEEFTRIVLDRLGDEGAIENPTLLWQEGTFARTKYKITGYSIPDDEERLILVTTIHTGEVQPRALTRDEILSALQQAMKFYECSCKGLHTKIEPSNTDASELARHIYEAREQIGVLRVVLLSDGLTGLRSIDLKKAFDGTRVIVDLFGVERLQRLLGQGLRRDDIVVDFSADFGGPLPCLKASSGSADYEAYLASIPGALLADVYEKYGTRLLELNVRAFLGLRGRKSVNAGLRTTIRDLPHRFLAYNNGIVATVDSMEVEDSGNGYFGVKSVRGLQIVNGGQTTASLHRAKRQDGANLDAISVPAKIICVSGADLDEMVAAVSKSANSQNTVQPADFSANDPFHVVVEKLANNTWLSDGKGRWFYERARGSYGAAELKASFAAGQKRRFAQETPKERRFSKTDLAKYLNAWEGQAHQVSFGNQKNFQFFMQALKDEHPDGFEPDTAWFKAFVAKAILFRATLSIVRGKKFAAFQANIVAYTIASLSWACSGRIDFDMIWTRQAISPELHKLLENWVGKIDKALRKTAGNRMVSEWAKKVDCRDALRELSFDLPDKLPPELVAQAGAGGRRSSRSNIQDDALRL